MLKNDATFAATQADEIVARFWSHVEKSETCWLWSGCRTRSGYGHFKPRDGLLVRAHRFSWTVTHGRIPNGLHVLHSCHNPACCNPGHLRLGTHKENMRDMALCQHGRRASTERQARLIKRLLARGVGFTEIARRVGVKRHNVQDIFDGRSWRYL